jgi:hypothetical protein
MIFNLTTISIMTLRIITHSITTFSIMTINIITISITKNTDKQENDPCTKALDTECYYTKRHK